MFSFSFLKIYLQTKLLKMNRIYLFILLTFTSYTFSQEYTAEQRANFANLLFTVSGSVTDSETNVPLEYATISLKHKKFPDKIFGGITDENGKFSVEVNPGMYNIKIDYISFESYVDDNLRVIENTDIGNTALNLDVSMLDEVEVRAERTQVEVRLDKKIYNVGQDITVRGGNVSDVLANIPSIEVDFDGNVSLRGNSNVKILINGKPSGLVGLAGPQGLRSIPSESIEKVEVVTSPSARYSAEGTAGILNIILKKQDLLGFNGNVNLNAGDPKSSGISGTFNLRNNKINIFNTTSFKDGDNNSNFNGTTEYFNSNLKIDNQTKSNRNSKNNFLNLGIEYYLDDKTSLTLSGFYRKGDQLSYSRNVVNDITNIDIVSSNERIANDKELEESFEYALDFYKDFDKDGHILSARISYEEDDENSVDNIEDFSTIPFVSSSAFERTTNIDFQNRLLAQIDYVYPIDENTEFELGYRGRFLDRETDFDVSFLRGGLYQSDSGLSNIFKYSENINSFYTQFGKKFNSLSVLLGLRYEDSKQEIDQRTTNQFEVKKYSDLFPTVNIAYQFSDLESLTLGYSKRVRRPRGWDINPFPRRNSITSYRRGNPFLDPTFTSAYEVDYLKRFKKITINTALFYRQSDGNVERIQQETGDLVNLIVESGSNNPVLQVPVLEYYPINLSTNKRIGSELSITYTPSRSVRINGSFTLNSTKIRGTYNNQSFDSDDTNWSARFNGFIRLPKDYSLQFFGFLRGPSENAFSKRKAFGFTTASIQKSILDKKGNISLRYSDIFNTGRFRSTTTRDTFRSESEGQWREPSWVLTFSYRINENQSKRKQRARNNQQDFSDGGGDEGPIFN
jgi:outer membrane receptor protein involved in Fe transport